MDEIVAIVKVITSSTGRELFVADRSMARIDVYGLGAPAGTSLFPSALAIIIRGTPS